jgi:hypothetical protein
MRTRVLALLAAAIIFVGLVIIPSAAFAGRPSSHGNGHGHGDPPTTTSGTSTNAKIAICHRTGSTTNPWVPITVSIHAWNAHAAHGDFRIDASHPCPPHSVTTTQSSSTSSSNSVSTVSVTQTQTVLTIVTVPVTTTMTQTITTTTTATP